MNNTYLNRLIVILLCVNISIPSLGNAKIRERTARIAVMTTNICTQAGKQLLASKTCTAAESTQSAINENKNNAIDIANSTEQSKSQFFKNFKQVNTLPPNITAIIVGLATGGITSAICNKIGFFSFLFQVGPIESKIREAIITDLQNYINQDDIQFKKKSMKYCSRFSSLTAFILLNKKKDPLELFFLFPW